MSDPLEFSPEVYKLFSEVDSKLVNLIQNRKFVEARTDLETLLSEIFREQERLGHRLHKGGPLHNLGVVELFNNKIEEAFKYFVLAYAEDIATNIETGKGDPQALPAANALIMNFRVGDDFFSAIRKKVSERLSKDGFKDPRRVFEALIQTKIGSKPVKQEIQDIKKDPLVQKIPLKLDRMPGKYKDRVFTGGSYDGEYYTRLQKIKSMVRKFGYEPILVEDFETPEDMSIRKKSLLLLHNCKYGIFDVSINAGQLIEVDRSTDYEVNALLVYKEAYLGKKAWTQMIQDKKPKPFRDEKDLEKLIKDFLGGDKNAKIDH